MKILVVDDEKLARDRLIRMIEKMGGHEIVGEAEDGHRAIAQVEALQPDILLLDIRMPGMDGLEVARHLMNLDNRPAIIFCTAYGEYALEAFQTQAMGYLLKPVNSEQLEAALQAATKPNRAQLLQITSTNTSNTENHAASSNRPIARRHISARSRSGLILIPVADVRCFIADHKYVTVYHTKGEVLIDDPLRDLEEEFCEQFVRIHRNALVSLAHVEGMEKVPAGHYQIRLQGTNFKPAISRRNVTDLRNQLKLL